MSERPELHLERVLDEPYERLDRALRAGPEHWLPGCAVQDGRPTAVLRYQQGGRWIERRIELRAGPVQQFAYGVTVRLEWRAARLPGLYPEFEGHLRLERRDRSRSIVRLDGRYAPPAGQIGAAADRAVMHHVARASVEDLLERLIGLLTRAASG